MERDATRTDGGELARQDDAIEVPAVVAPSQGAVSLRPATVGRPASRVARRFSWSGLVPFIAVVAAPTFAAIVYFGFIATDRYVAEAQFVVRSAQRAAPSGLGALLQSTGLSTTQDDANLVHAFVRSRDALRALETEIGFSEIMGAESVDPLSRWPNILYGDTFEEMHDYYQSRITVASDVTTGISTLRVEAFTPEDARMVAATLLEQSEAFVNDLNARAERDTLEQARREVALAEQRVAANQAAFDSLRRERGLVDPTVDTEMRFEMVAALSVELATTEAEVSRLRRDAPNSPQIATLASRAEALREQIAAERARLVGADGALIESFGAFESLALEREFAAEALLAARGAQEQARAEAAQKQLYLARVVSPSTPDFAREPRRVTLVLTVLSVSLLVYAVLWLLYVNAHEHRS